MSSYDLVYDFDNQQSDLISTAWHSGISHGFRVSDAYEDIKLFAFECFDLLDADGNGFLTRDELLQAFEDASFDWRERSYISFLLRRCEDIEAAYIEEWQNKEGGISRADIQEYFNKLIISSSASIIRQE